MSNPLPPSSLRGAVDLSALVNRANQPAPGAGGAPASGAPGASGVPGAAGAPGAPGAGAPQPGSIVFSAGDATFEQVLDLSATVPVIVEIIAPGLEPALGAIVESYGGRLALAVVDGSTSPQIAQAFQVREVPAVSAVVGGRPLSLFVGIPSDAEVRQVLDQVLTIAAQNDVTGRLEVAGPDADGEEPAEPVEPPLPPLHQEAYDAIEQGDFDAAIAAYRKAIAQNPRDSLAVAGLAQVSLLARLGSADAGAVRAAAAAAPADVTAQLAVADLDVSGGHLDDAFARLLELFPSLDQEGKDAVRARLLEYFEIAGPEDPRVGEARKRLTYLLF